MPTAEEIVIAWRDRQPEETTSDLAAKLGIDPGALRQRMLNLRKRGVNLPLLSKPLKRVDVAALNGLLAEKPEPEPLKKNRPAKGRKAGAL